MSTRNGESKVFWAASKEVEGVMIGRTLVDGPTALAFGNIHPDEPSGGEVVEKLPRTIQTLVAGTLFAVQANQEAMKTGTRHSIGGSNINRAFKRVPGQELRSDLTYEERRAAELMDYFESIGDSETSVAPLSALIDFHGFEDPNGKPFIISEAPSDRVARAIGPEIIAHGFAEAEPGGTDDWGHRLGLTAAICYEIGSMDEAGYAAGVRRGDDAMQRFLGALDMKHGQMPPEHKNPMIVSVNSNSAYIRRGDTFEMARKFESFEPLALGEHVATDGDHHVYADSERQQVMIFPKPTAPAIGREAFALGYIEER